MKPVTIEYGKNLCQRPDAQAMASVMPSTGNGKQDINYILTCVTPWEDGLWCDTFDGLNEAPIDWWAVHWSEQVWCNVVQYLQGPMTASGGWWRSLAVEYQTRSDSSWQRATNLQISPAYDFSDRRGNRMPYQQFTLVFDRARCTGLRLIGQPGGLAQHTKIAQLAIYDHDLSIWMPPPPKPPPTPRILRLLPPGEVFRILARLYPVCDILFTLIAGRLNLIHSLNERDYAKWKSISRFSADPTDFWRRVYDREGSKCWYALTQRLIEQVKCEQRALTGVREDGLAQIVAPLIVDGQILGILRNISLVCVEPFDQEKQRAYARNLQLDEDLYLSKLAQVPKVSLKKLDAIGALLDSVTNLLRDLSLRNELIGAYRTESRRTYPYTPSEIVQQSLQYMRANLENPTSVADVAKSLALSPAHFSRIFHQETGRSPSQYLIDLRMERSCFLLRNCRVSVAEACVAVGYSSIPSFIRVFKHRMVLTPAQYKKES